VGPHHPLHDGVRPGARGGEIEIPLADIADQLHARVDQL